jgi:hypothetical protein
MSASEVRLLGEWRTDPADVQSLREYGDVSLLFEPGGMLRYTIHSAHKEQVILLLFRVEGTSLVTNQRSSPREERTIFFFENDGRLVLKNAPPSPPGHYVRVRLCSAPPAGVGAR